MSKLRVSNAGNCHIPDVRHLAPKEHEREGVATFRVAGTAGRHAAFGTCALSNNPAVFSRNGHAQSLGGESVETERNGFYQTRLIASLRGVDRLQALSVRRNTL
jgi:hypothetical protein